MKKRRRARGYSKTCQTRVGCKEEIWLLYLASQVGAACDKFWQQTEERRQIDAEYRKHKRHPWLVI